MKTKETNKQKKKNRKNGGEGGPAYSRREIFKKQTKTRKKKENDRNETLEAISFYHGC